MQIRVGGEGGVDGWEGDGASRGGDGVREDEEDGWGVLFGD